MIVIKFNKLRGPKNSSVNRRRVVHVFKYHILRAYRGWLLIRNLPIKGQRTWSNAWTATRCNLQLKPLIAKRGKTFYGGLPASEIYTAYLAEYINKKWRQHWRYEWERAKFRRLIAKAKKRKPYRVDLFSMAKGHIITRRRMVKLTKKQKAQHDFNNYSMGFTPGFTKALLSKLFNMRKNKENRFARDKNLILNKNDLKSKRRKRIKKSRWKS